MLCTAPCVTVLRNRMSQVPQAVHSKANVLHVPLRPQDFVFCKEVRLGSYAPTAATLPPAAIVAAKAMAVDPRAEPRYAERVPYVVRVVLRQWGDTTPSALPCLALPCLVSCCCCCWQLCLGRLGSFMYSSANKQSRMATVAHLSHTPVGPSAH